MPDSDFNQHGQRIGAKGERTRRLLIDATIELLESRGLRDVSVADVARRAKVATGTFYVYFRGVPEVVLSALHNAVQTSPELVALVEQDWLGPDAYRHSLAFVEEYCRLWQRNRTVLRVRNLAGEEGDERFIRARAEAAAPMLAALQGKIETAKAAGLLPSALPAWATAATILMMLERLSAIGPAMVVNGVTMYDDLQRSAAFTICAMIGGQGSSSPSGQRTSP